MIDDIHLIAAVGRDAGDPAAPAQIPACATNALGSSLGSNVKR